MPESLSYPKADLLDNFLTIRLSSRDEETIAYPTAAMAATAHAMVDRWLDEAAERKRIGLEPLVYAYGDMLDVEEALNMFIVNAGKAGLEIG